MRTWGPLTVALAGALVLAGCSSAPDTFIGPPPRVVYPSGCSDAGCQSNSASADLYWAVGDVGYSTRLSLTGDGASSPMTFGQVDGSFELINGYQCRATVEWTLTPDPESPRPPMGQGLLSTSTPESPALDDDSIPPETREVRLNFRRLDSAPCWAHVAWMDAAFE